MSSITAEIYSFSPVHFSMDSYGRGNYHAYTHHRHPFENGEESIETLKDGDSYMEGRSVRNLHSLEDHQVFLLVSTHRQNRVFES
ncbi:MAG: hypothetical protein IIT40_11885 [Prevotella sp.]|nr:hypothetical protein [Prevotella sp.]